MGLIINDPTGANTSGDGEYKRIGDVKPGWSISGDATPHSLASTSGGTGTLTFNASQAGGESDLLIARDTLVDGAMGKFSSVTLQGENVNLTSDTLFARLNTQRSASTWATDLYAGDIQIPNRFTIMVGGVAKNSDMVAQVHASDYYGNETYFLTYWSEGTVLYPVIVRYATGGRFVSATALIGGTAPDTSGWYGRAMTINKANGDIWITNSVSEPAKGNWVKRFTNAGVFVSEFRPGATSGTLTSGSSLAIDGSGNIYVSGGSSANTNYVQKFSPTGTFLAGMGTTANESNVYGFGVSAPKIVFNGTDLVAVGIAPHTLRTYNTSLVHRTTTQLPEVRQTPRAITIDYSTGTIYVFTVSSKAKPMIWTYNKSGIGYAIVKTQTISNEFADDINTVATDGKGRLYVPAVDALPATRSVLQTYFVRDGAAPLSTMIHYYTCLVLPLSSFEFRFNAADPTVLFPSWEGNVWEHLKELGAAWGLEFRATVTTSDPLGARFKSVIEVATIGGTPEPLDQADARSLTLKVSMASAVRSYEITAQNPTEAPLGVNRVVYQSGVHGGTHSVAASQRIFTQVITPHSVVGVLPALPELGSWPSAPAAGFEVWDSENIRLPTGLFTSYAGSVQAHVIDGHTIGLVIAGPYVDIPGYPGPYKFASPTGEGRLNIGGSGTLVDPQAVRIWTGADEGYITNDNGPKLDSPFISTLGQAYDCAAWASYELSGPRMELSYDVIGATPTPGQRIRYNHQNWRIMNVNRTATGSRVTAEAYTTTGDKDAQWAGKTVAQYDAFWNGYRGYDSKVRPLQTTR